ncbi:MAG: permease prefix domain 1-containing protein [Nocardioides sp.]|uniref:permease prefix domain 1-containing protein n=1 Tax=Nocardioides sp. TaxID=35761 RepID=UPI003F128AE3
MPATLTQRYVHATVRDLPAERRDDLARELSSTIEDMVEGHLAAGMTPEEAERAALVELGHPANLAASYSGRPQYLIGPRFYGIWERLTKNLLLWVPITVAALSALGDATDTSPDTLGGVIASAVVTLLGTALQVAFWTTAVFAVIDRVTTDDDLGAFSPDSLPDLPDDHQGITLGEAVAGAVFNLILGGLIVAQQFRTGVGEDGTTPLLNPDLWSLWLPVLIVGCVASAALELWRYRAGWTVPTFLGTVVTSVATAGPIAWLAQEHRLLNPDFLEAVSLTGRNLDVTMDVVMAGAVLVALWEIVEGVWRTFVRPSLPPRGH